MEHNANESIEITSSKWNDLQRRASLTEVHQQQQPQTEEQLKFMVTGNWFMEPCPIIPKATTNSPIIQKQIPQSFKIQADERLSSSSPVKSNLESAASLLSFLATSNSPTSSSCDRISQQRPREYIVQGNNNTPLSFANSSTTTTTTTTTTRLGPSIDYSPIQSHYQRPTFVPSININQQQQLHQPHIPPLPSWFLEEKNRILGQSSNNNNNIS
jgi:hypothetical protein